MIKNIKKASVLLFLLIIFTTNTVFADHCTDCYNGGTPCGYCGYSCSTDPELGCVDRDERGANYRPEGWWAQASWFFSNGTSSVAGEEMAEQLSSITDMIFVVGNMIFFAVTVVLGVKYIWGGADSKANVKDSLITLIIAATVFYGWQLIEGIFTGSDFIDPDSFENTASNIYSIIIYIANFAAIGGLVYIGVRYLMSGAAGRADLKAKSVPVMLGIVMVYCTLGFLNLITSIIS